MKSLAAATLGLLVAATSATETQTTSASDSTNKSLKFDLERVHLKGNETIDDPAEDIQLGPKSGTYELAKVDYRYQAPVFFGSQKNKAMMSFDTGSSYTVVTSDLCPTSNCASKAYKPGTSETTFNLNQRYQLEIDQGGNTVKMQTYAFIDSVCLQGEDELCASDFQFYAINSQTGLSSKQDGIVGMAPVQTNKHSDEGPSFVAALKKQKVIDKAIVSLFVSRFESKTHSIQIGDFDTSLVNGGEPHLHWFGLAVPENVGSWRWQTDLTDAYLGEHNIFRRSYKWVEVNAAYASVGFTTEDYEKASAKLMNTDSTITCDEKSCFGREECATYAGKMPDVTFTISNRVNATLPGDELLADIVDSDDFKCQIKIANSGDFYLMGEPFLRYYYSVYDFENHRLALGRVVDFDAPPVEPEGAKVPEGGHSSREDDQNFVRNASIFAAIVIVFFACACFLQKRRGDVSESGSSAAKTARKQLRLTEDNPNRSLIEGQMDTGQLHFVEASEHDSESVNDGTDTYDDESLPQSALEAEDA